MPENGTQSTVVRTNRGLSITGTRITLYYLLDYVRAEWPPKPGQEAIIAKLRARKAELGLS